MQYLNFQPPSYKPGVYSKPFQTSQMERFAKIVNGFFPLTTFTKRHTLDVSHKVLNTSLYKVTENTLQANFSVLHEP